MAIGRAGDPPGPARVPPSQPQTQTPATTPGAAAPSAPRKTESANQVTPAAVPTGYERQGRGSLDGPHSDEGRALEAAKQELF
ncbi:MAG TPA: hypothetical protein VFB81_08600, partial [Myxococcales bacterium]|nr:hypothetical protein [Myxococcales bacterium]